MINYKCSDGLTYSIRIYKDQYSSFETWISIYCYWICDNIININDILTNSISWQNGFISGFYSCPPLPKDLKTYVEKLVKLKAFI